MASCVLGGATPLVDSRPAGGEGVHVNEVHKMILYSKCFNVSPGSATSGSAMTKYGPWKKIVGPYIPTSILYHL